MTEKRKHRRVNLIYYLEIHDQKTNYCIGHLVDISQGGIRMVSEFESIPDIEHNIQIYLPEDSSQKSVTMRAKSCWTQKDINPAYNASGLEFVELSEENTKIIKKMMNRYGMVSSLTGASYG